MVTGRLWGAMIPPASCVARLDHPPENRFALHEFASHAPPLRTLAAHDEGDAGRVLAPWRESRPHLRGSLAQRVGSQFLNGLRGRACDNGETVLVVIASGPERVSEIRQHR